MTTRFAAFFLFSCLLVPSAFAQNSDADRETRMKQAQMLEEARRAEETRRMFDKLSERSSSPSSFSRSPSKGSAERTKFYQTVPLFREATSRYRESMGTAPDLKSLVKDIEKLISPLRDYFDTMKFKLEPVDLSEFQSLSPKDLAWETLIVAERTDNNLQLALRLVQQSDNEGAINIRALEFFADIQDDLSRLKWLTSKVAEGGASPVVRK